jgi:uncharacterized surface protein with fasciclin (FAS1) repeats
MHSKDHTTVAAVKAAGLVETLKEKDLCFAPTNAAFAKLPTVETLLKPENLKTLNDSYLPRCVR